MRASWLELTDSLFRPSRPHRERCAAARDAHLDSRRRLATERAAAVARCEARIEAERAAVFAAQDGVVTRRMTELERDWRRLSRPDPDAGMMDLWARIAPARWIDQKRWRDAPPGDRTDVAILLAADVDGVEAAEAAVGALCSALAALGTCIGTRVRWTPFAGDFTGTRALLDPAMSAARAHVLARDGGAAMLARAERLAAEARGAILAVLPERRQLADAIGEATNLDCLWDAGAHPAHTNPAAALHRLWRTGYVLAGVDAASGVTLAIPPS